MKRVMLLIFLLMSGMMLAHAGQEWNEGVVVLKNNEVLTGHLFYVSDLDLVQVKSNGKTLCYSASQVQFFNIHDVSMGAVRRFVPAPYVNLAKQRKDVFFEVIIDDRISLLRKKSPYSTGSGQVKEAGVSEHISDYDYFFEFDGLVFASSQFKQELMQIINSYMANEVAALIKSEGLNLNKISDQIKVVQFFNASGGSAPMDGLLQVLN